MFRKTAAVVAIGLMCVAGQASAAGAVAQVSSAKGAVMVSQGAGYASTAPGAALNAGDRIVAMEGGAQVSYADGCVVNVAPQGVVTVGAASPCSAALASGAEPANLFEMSGFTGALVIFGIGLLLIALAYDNDDDPISP